MASGIYQITNQVSGKRYIGSSVNLKRRRQNHFSALCCGEHENQHLQSAFNKYDEEAFVFEVLEEIKPEKLIEREQYYFDTLKPEYNIAPTAGSPLGVRHTDEARANMSTAQRGRHHSMATRRKISEANKGRPVSIETRRRHSAAKSGERNPMYDRHPSAETLAKLRAAKTGKRNPFYGKHHSAETRKKISIARKVYWHKIHAIKSASLNSSSAEQSKVNFSK